MKFKEVRTGGEFIGFLVVREVSAGTTRNGTAFLNLKLYDGQSELPGKIWDHEGNSPKSSSVIKVQGLMGEYNGTPQITVSRWRQAEEKEYSIQDFLPSYQGDVKPLFEKIYTTAQSIKDSILKAVVINLLDTYKSSFTTSPAAVSYHHAYIGGLVEHTQSVLHLALNIAQNSPEYIDTDLIIAGAILHDIGKIHAYKWESSIEMTDDGRFLDHIVLGIVMVQEESKRVGLSWETTRKLLHVVSSHHGRLEWGSPVEPVLKEAMIVHHADLIDTTMNKVDIGFESDQSDESWVRLKTFKHPLYRTIP
jgi:3'-5' exoribonuclease